MGSKPIAGDTSRPSEKNKEKIVNHVSRKMKVIISESSEDGSDTEGESLGLHDHQMMQPVIIPSTDGGEEILERASTMKPNEGEGTLETKKPTEFEQTTESTPPVDPVVVEETPKTTVLVDPVNAHSVGNCARTSPFDPSMRKTISHPTSSKRPHLQSWVSGSGDQKRSKGSTFLTAGKQPMDHVSDSNCTTSDSDDDGLDPEVVESTFVSGVIYTRLGNTRSVVTLSITLLPRLRSSGCRSRVMCQQAGSSIFPLLLFVQ